jgi:ATP synthase F1 delta subunit
VQNDELDSLYEDTKELLGLIKASEDLSNILKSPLTKNSLKLSIIKKLTSGFNSSKILEGLLETLSNNKRLNLLDKVLDSFAEVLLTKRGYQSAKVTSAYDIDQQTKKNISDLLNSQYDSKINIVFNTNQSLLGGMTVVVGSKMVDLSVRNQVLKFTSNVKGDI